jgi:hypothetical protein
MICPVFVAELGPVISNRLQVFPLKKIPNFIVPFLKAEFAAEHCPV